MSNDQLIPDLWPDTPGSDAILVNPADLGKVYGPDWGALVLPWEETPVGEAWFATVDLGLEDYECPVWVDEEDPSLLHFKLAVSVIRVKTRATISDRGALVITFEMEKHD